MTESVRLRGIAGPPGSRLGKLIGDRLELPVSTGSAPVPFSAVVAEVVDEGSSAAAGTGLPAGEARAEAIAVRLARAGAQAQWDSPVVVADVAELIGLCRRRGASSMALIDADPSLLDGMQVGSWFDARWRLRLMRRVGGLPGAGRALSLLARTSPRWLVAAADIAFWRGVRGQASGSQWRRLTASSYVALVYHRFAGELKPGQERIDIAPRRFGRQLRALRLLRFRPLPAQELLAFHAGGGRLPRRAVAITVDDGTADCVEPLRGSAAWSPLLFVPTRELGRTAHWIDGEPVAGWEEIEELTAAGVGIGSHTRHHRRLTTLEPQALVEELRGSLADLRERLPDPLEIVAYPNGDHDAAVCAASRSAGYLAGFTTEKGRNGAGTDRFRLKRVSVHGDDGALAAVWKATTGEGLPAWWLRLRRLRGR
jgi:peptidoglycan/xylan/chitin deacetylase (PgdA/CDA1 family)